MGFDVDYFYKIQSFGFTLHLTAKVILGKTLDIVSCRG